MVWMKRQCCHLSLRQFLSGSLLMSTVRPMMTLLRSYAVSRSLRSVTGILSPTLRRCMILMRS
uniref:Uncharacterized protein n=1 Tax=Setaria italica TaxID=4555 RepID=K3Z1H5_SETIT